MQKMSEGYNEPPPPAGYGAPPTQYGMQPQMGYGAPQQPGYGTPSQAGYGIQSAPVMAQPGAPAGPYVGQVPVVQWMPAPAPIPGCPAGMEYLTQLDQLLVQQETHILEIMTGWECRNKFKVMNSMGQQVYYALEESEICQRMCCGPERGFVYHITDNAQQEVFRVRRDFKCCTGCFCCPGTGCHYFAQVEDRNGEILGHVSNLTFCCSPLFGIYDASKNLIAEIQGPCCPCQTVCCTNDIDFIITDKKDGTEMGKISKQWPGLVKEMFTDSDNFRVSFPVNLDVKKKALMFGAIFILDIMMYEHKQNN